MLYYLWAFVFCAFFVYLNKTQIPYYDMAFYSSLVFYFFYSLI